MKKSELIKRMSEKTGLSKADTKKALEAFIVTTSDALKQGDNLSLKGFGSFTVSERSQRSGRNPSTGKAMLIPAHNVVQFKAGNYLKGTVNKGTSDIGAKGIDPQGPAA